MNDKNIRNDKNPFDATFGTLSYDHEIELARLVLSLNNG